MMDRRFFEGMNAEECDEARRLFEVTEAAAADERWRMCCLMASKKEGQLLGKTEFTLRDQLLKVGAIVLQEAVNGRRKKGLPG